MKAPKAKPEEESVMSISPRKGGANSSTDLLMKRYEKDLQDVLRQFEIDYDSTISEVTMVTIMAQMGFIQVSNNTDVEAVQDIWRHLQPVGGGEPQAQ